jgi:centrosomal protein CEP19
MGDTSFPDYQPKRFGLQYNPPMIVLEYLVPSTGKLYHHKMRLQRLTASSEAKTFLDYLRKRHSVYLSHTKITDEQLTGLIIQLRDHMKPDMNKLDLNKLTPEAVA